MTEGETTEGAVGAGETYDVIVVGAGLAGLSLSRHLLRETGRRVLLIERRPAVPGPHQKVGESLVQVGGWYFSKFLDLEEHLLREHFLKYNLRFYWKSPGRANDRFEDYGQGFIRKLSNVVSYQLDRNKLEAEILRLNLESPRFTFRPDARGAAVELGRDGELHTVRWTDGQGPDAPARSARARWVVDTSGRGRVMAKEMDLRRPNPVRHGAFFWWVDGLVDVEKLTDSTPRQIRGNPDRSVTGHVPFWLATNHFCAEGLWFWVIPLQGKTSLGLVFDKTVVDFDHRDVFTVERATEWVCKNFPLFARDLPQREVLDFGGLKDYSYDCAQTISAERWAMAGEAGRFSDPLYSPGSDLISFYNTMIVDAIETGDDRELAEKCSLYENLMRAVYAAYIPSYAKSYDVLGDQEAFCLKYSWELTVYFAAYVFPFINELFTDRRFALAFLRLFSQLGPMNRGIQELLSDFFQWKKTNRRPPDGPRFFDFTEIEALARAETTFYRVGVDTSEAKTVLAEQVRSLRELARFVVAHVASVVLDDERVATDRAFVEGVDLDAIAFDPEGWRARWQGGAGIRGEPYPWSFDPTVMSRFHAGSALAQAAS